MSLKYLGKLDILMIEDDIFNIQLVSAMLKKVSHMNVLPVKDGIEALSMLKDKEMKIDTILLDLHLPGMQGKEILMKIREDRTLDEIPVFIISADGMDELELLNMGANDFITKPFDIDIFVEKFSAYLAA